ncbi:MAG: FecR domain-containing protein [Rhodospirillales bacterium]
MTAAPENPAPHPDQDPLDQAMDWLLRVNAAPGDRALRSALDAWIAADPAHRRAFDRAGRTWQLLGDAAPAPTQHPARPPAKRPASRRMPLATVAGLALAACLAVVIAPDVMIRAQADFTTATAEAREITLEDGSRIDLGPESAVTVRYAEDRRDVTLLAGEAFFRVTPDADRPFTVENGGVAARVLGTAFNVRALPDAVDVQVAEGRVRVTYADKDPSFRADLSPGQGVHVTRRTGLASQTKRQPADIALWRDGKLFVADATVAEVATVIDRYQPGWIMILDGALAQARVNGLYDLTDPARALRALVQPAGGRVTRASPWLHVLTGP